MTDTLCDDCKEKIEKRTANLRLLFAHAAVGDFSTKIEIPENDDEFSELYAGADIMLDVINQQLAELRAQAAHEEKLNKAKSEFVALVSHQLRTPLTILKWSLEKIHTDYPQLIESPEGTDIRRIESVVEQMDSLVSAILNISRIELGTFSIKTETLDLPKSIDEEVQQMHHAADVKNITISASYEPASFTMQADKKLLKVIIENLLSNAIKYSPRGGMVFLKVRSEPTRTLIEVTDTGYGIPKEEEPHIFSKLFRGSKAITADPTGAGLGLHIIKLIVTETGGNIWFAEGKKDGASFFVTFPPEGMRTKPVKN